jgi:tetratricopeptide (TPR) repeat protein/transcriptional regulator with XRE-family HTH domain
MSADASASGPVKRPRLAQRRKALGLTQESLAALLAVERSTVIRWERGETEPLPWLRPKLAKALRVSADRLEELLGGDSDGDDDDDDAATTAPRQLPAMVAHFTGRAAELRALTRVLDDAGAPGTVVISAIGGTAGVGKTALALHWAHQAARRFPDGQLYVNLRGYDPDRPMPATDALAVFLRALGVPGPEIPANEPERAARYRSLLAGRRVLVVLDNAGSAEQAEPLLPGSATCAVVVTSRDSLPGLLVRYGAARLDLDLLPPGDAVALLRELIGDRARAEPETVATLADRCGRLPLALRVAAELAAARPGVPLTDLAAELADEQRRLDVLDAGGDPRTAVRAVFSWSCQRLDPPAARVFRLGGLHPGGDFEPYAIAALTETSLAGATRALDALARGHLIQPAASGRYGLHDLLRGYARELAADQDSDDERRAALTRLFDHYLYAAATAMDTLHPAGRENRPRAAAPVTPVPSLADSAAALTWLDAEIGTLTAVSAYAAAHGWPRYAMGLSETLFRYLDAGGHHAEATIIHGHARDAARQAGGHAAEANALNYLAGVHYRQGRYAQAAGDLEQALALYRRASDRNGQAQVLGNLGVVHFELGNYQQAASLIRQAMDLSPGTLDQSQRLNTLGIIEERLGRYEQAAQYMRQVLVLSRESGDRVVEARTLGNLGHIRLRQGRLDEAAGLGRQSLACSREVGSRGTEFGALTCLGDAYLRLERYQEAAEHIEQALAVARATGGAKDEADGLALMGLFLLATGKPGDARDTFAAVLDLAVELDLGHMQARAFDGLGRACQALGDADEARGNWQQALAIFTELGVPEAEQVRARLAASQDATA